ncbi:hypothetical protein A0H81_09999 [Grifola frondosa]|uniref:Uncharacterized protein n=1 Tax=Grifola frondosa TaxID=5627 RepID=A0A1C7M052_GRIFR|nr:hypothetical protein A0H81_09999 [Grifola frondosa]
MEWAGDQSKHTDMPANSVDASEEALHPGQCYVIYNTLDLLGSLPEEYELVISRAARWAGVDDDYVCGVVERFERRLVRWWDGVRRKERRENNTETETLVWEILYCHSDVTTSLDARKPPSKCATRENCTFMPLFVVTEVFCLVMVRDEPSPDVSPLGNSEGQPRASCVYKKRRFLLATDAMNSCPPTR